MTDILFTMHCLNFLYFFVLLDLHSMHARSPDHDSQGPSYTTPYNHMQYPTVHQPLTSSPYHINSGYYPQQAEDWCPNGIYELKRISSDSLFSIDTEIVDLPPAKKTRISPYGCRVKGDELCVVCGDKASGYHYNALTCEGCKGKKDQVYIIYSIPTGFWVRIIRQRTNFEVLYYPKYCRSAVKLWHYWI